MAAAGESCRSVRVLIQHGSFRDTFVAARTAFLTLVNVCFICAEGEQTAERAFRHAAQRAFKNLDRTEKAGEIRVSVKFSGVPDLKSNPELAEMVREFEHSRGGNWTDKTLSKQLAAIEQKYGARITSFLLFGVDAIHRQASEIAHGTVYSVMWHFGMFAPGSQGAPDQRAIFRQEQLITLLFVLNLCLHAGIVVVTREFSLLSEREETDSIVRELLARLKGQ